MEDEKYYYKYLKYKLKYLELKYGGFRSVGKVVLRTGTKSVGRKFRSVVKRVQKNNKRQNRGEHDNCVNKCHRNYQGDNANEKRCKENC